MREIKFRVIIDGVKYYWGWIDNHFIGLPVVSTLNLTTLRQDDVIKLSCQFTGLKDKNGKEIYEGDIIGGCRYANDKKVVEWNELRTGYIPFENDIHWEEANEIEVIGNIYENPNLLS